MKKTYILPQLHINEVACERLLAESEFDVNTEQSVDRQYVKENTSSPSYNVWDDDWSKN